MNQTHLQNSGQAQQGKTGPDQAKASGQKTQQAHEEDEFEDFDDYDWDERFEDPENAHIWESGWDDDNTSDKFSAALKAHLTEKKPQSTGATS